jgi:hypothetical protein
MKNFFILSVFCFLLSAFFPVYANDYVLPYPSFMPGNKLYRISRIIDKLQNYWNWGSLAQERYHLELSDKYFVESKILFEYKQFLLGVDALRRSNDELLFIRKNILEAKSEGKNVDDVAKNYLSALEKHQEVLHKIKQIVPAVFEWAPEKERSTILPLYQLLDDAILLRKKETILLR